MDTTARRMGIDPLSRDDAKRMSAELRRDKKKTPSGKKGSTLKKYRLKGTKEYYYYSYAS